MESGSVDNTKVLVNMVNGKLKWKSPSVKFKFLNSMQRIFSTNGNNLLISNGDIEKDTDGRVLLEFMRSNISNYVLTPKYNIERLVNIEKDTQLRKVQEFINSGNSYAVRGYPIEIHNISRIKVTLENYDPIICLDGITHLSIHKIADIAKRGGLIIMNCDRAHRLGFRFSSPDNDYYLNPTSSIFCENDDEDRVVRIIDGKPRVYHDNSVMRFNDDDPNSKIPEILNHLSNEDNCAIMSTYNFMKLEEVFYNNKKLCSDVEGMTLSKDHTQFLLREKRKQSNK